MRKIIKITLAVWIILCAILWILPEGDNDILSVVKADETDVELELTASSSHVYHGDEVIILVRINKNAGLTAIRFQISFDETVFEIISTESKETLQLPTVHKDVSFVGYSFAALNQDMDGNFIDWHNTGELLELKLKVKDTASLGSTKIYFNTSQTDAADLDGEALELTAKNVTLEIYEKSSEISDEAEKETLVTYVDVDNSEEYMQHMAENSNANDESNVKDNKSVEIIWFVIIVLITCILISAGVWHQRKESKERGTAEK